jgi:hypothetical protein
VRSRRIVLALVLLQALAVSAAGAARADSASPHIMVLPDGKLDQSKCGACHTPDMSLLGTKLETCTLCHSEAEHSGSREHIGAAKEKVAVRMQARAKDSIELPLAEDGKIYCGTCHLYHDPKVLDEAWLASGWVPPDSGLPGAVRESVIARWARLDAGESKDPLGEFASTGTRQLRLPVSDGSLCVQCHGDKR